MRADNPSTIRVALVTGIAISLIMMAVKVFLYRPLLAIPVGLAFVLETTGLLVSYAVLVVWATSDGPLRRAALLSGTPLGVVAGAIQVAHLTQETTMDWGAVWNGISGFGLLFCTFLLWGVAGYRTTRRTGALWSGTMAGFWSAIVTMSILVMFGFVEFYLAMPKPEYVVTWGEFKRSGWADIHAFTIANTLDAAQSHLIAGPIVGAIFGGIAGVIARMQHKQEPNPAVRLA
ncbi:MAG: hypothetical protein ACR2NN_22585 [Bryobacteraceae bacterium]